MIQNVERVLQNVLPLTLRLDHVITMTDEQFGEFCETNEIVRIERTADGALELNPLLVGLGGAKVGDIIASLGMWTRADESGCAYTNAGFILPNGAMRAPTAGWISKSRLVALTADERKGFYPLCPDFVIEMRWYTDKLSVLQAKMEEYMANGTKLGWLLDPSTRQARIYRPGAPPEIIDNPASLSADPELPGFTLDLTPIWEPAF